MKKPKNGLVEPGLHGAPSIVTTPVLLSERDQMLMVSVDFRSGKIVDVQELMPPRVNYARPLFGSKAAEAEMRREEWKLLEKPEAMDLAVTEPTAPENN